MEYKPENINNTNEKINFEKLDANSDGYSNKEDSTRTITHFDNEISFKRQSIEQTMKSINDIKAGLGLPPDKNLDIPSIKFTEDKITILTEEKSKLNPINNTESGWGVKPIFPETKTFSWDNIPNVERKLSDKEKMFQDYDSKIGDISNILKNAQFITEEEALKINGGIISSSMESPAVLEFKKMRLNKILEQIDFSVFKNALNYSPYKYKCFEKLEELQSGINFEQISVEINKNISAEISKIIRANPEILSIDDFLKKAEKITYLDNINYVEYEGETYNKNEVIEGAVGACLDSIDYESKDVDEKNTNDSILKTTNENMNSMDMNEIIENSDLFKKSLTFLTFLADEDVKYHFKIKIALKLRNGNDYDARNILDSNDVLIKKSGEKIAKNKIEHEFGVANFDLNTWRGNGIKYNENLNIMKQIEAIEPGSVKKLVVDYGIMEFHRYPVEILIDQIKEESVQNPYGVVIFPKSDHNGAFDNQTEMLKHLYFQTRGKYGLKIAECGSKFDLARKFISLDNKYGKNNKISFVLLGGHGSGDSISLGSDDPRLNNYDRELAKGKVLFSTESNNASFKKANEKYLDKDAEIMFLSCSTGEEGGIAEKFSGSFDKKVVAPKIPISRMDLKINYNNNGKPHFDVIYNDDKNLSAEYQSGIINNES